MPKRIIFGAILLFAMLLPVFVSAQTEQTDADKGIIYMRERSYYIGLHSQGWGGGWRKSFFKTGFKKRILEIELVKMNHPKETRTENPYFGNASSYIFGQLNSIYVARFGTGFYKILNDKPYWGGIQLSYVLSGGFSCALARPKYIYYIIPDASNMDYTLSLERYDPNIHTQDYIYGGGPILKGFEKLKPYPGAYVKLGMMFEFGEYAEKTRAVEIGTTFDVYASEIPMMAFNTYPRYFLTFYVNFQFGKRYNLY